MHEWLDIFLRLGVAVVLAGAVGIERQFHGRWADLRTYMSVSMAACIFVIVGQQAIIETNENPPPNWIPDVTRVIQGIATGVGFLGAGTILKLSDQLEIKGLTTASSIWLAAALGTASGLALYPLAVAGTIVTLLVLAAFRPLEKHFETQSESEE